MVRALASSSSSSPPRPWYLWPNLLGLDAPLVAVVWCWFYAHVQGVDLPRAIYLVLAGAVWSIYAADRLLDIRYLRNQGAAFTERHHFVRKHWLAFFAALTTVTGLGLYGAGWVIPQGLLFIGLAILVASVFYFLLVWSPRNHRVASGLRIVLAGFLGYACWLSSMSSFLKILYGLLLLALVYLSITRTHDRPRIEPPKELIAGLIFALGCILPAAFFTPAEFNGIGTRILALWAIFSLNCLSISWTERQIDREGDPAALPQRLPWIGKLLPFLCAATIPLAGVLFHLDILRGGSAFFGAVGVSATGLLALVFCGSLVPRTLGRVLADVVLLTPLLFLWLP